MAPSNELRKWHGHEPAKWDEFQTRYKKEMVENVSIDKLLVMAMDSDLSLVFSTADKQRCSALVLKDVLESR